MNSKFIVIEGLDATGKSTLAPKLGNRLGATLLQCPPKLESLDLSPNLRAHFDNRPPNQRRAYYRAANLIASEMAEAALKVGHVVMDRLLAKYHGFCRVGQQLAPRPRMAGVLSARTP